MLVSGMNNASGPFGRPGFAVVDLKNMEFWPRGSISRRRGFQPYLSAATPSCKFYDLFVYDHLVGTTRTLDLVVREGANGDLWSNNVCNTITESTQGAWVNIGGTSVWSTSTLGGQAFSRESFLYASDGACKKGWGRATAASRFILGLATPTGTPGYGLLASSRPGTGGRLEPGYYDWGFTGYHETRNVESLPLFAAPSTLHYGTPGAWNTYHTLGGIPDMLCTMQVGLSNLGIDGKATHVNIYRRHPMDLLGKPANRMDNARLVASIAPSSTTFQDVFNDHELGARLTFAGTPPPAWIAAAEFHQRWLYIPAAHPWRVYFSEVDGPEMVAQDTTLEGRKCTPILVVDGNDSAYNGEAWIGIRRNAGPGKAILPIGDIALILCENQTWGLMGSGPTDYQFQPIDENVGCIAPHPLATPHGGLWWSQQGLVWWRGGRPKVVSSGVLDFDGATSPVRLARGSLKNAVAAYDPVREQAEFAVTGFGASGNNLIIVLDLGLSTPDSPVFYYYVPSLQTGETITAMTTLHQPSRAPLVLYTTNKGRVLHRTGSADHNGTALVPFECKIAAWAGADSAEKVKGHFGLKLTHSADYAVTVAASLWSRETCREPTTGEAPTDQGAIACSTNQYGATGFGARGNMIYLRLRETAASNLTIHDLAPYGQKGSDWRF